jgi:apolipoprotein N-acyltransferase
MVQIESYGSSFQRPKQIVIAAAFVLSILIAPFYVLFPDGSAQSTAVRFGEMIGFSFLILAWCHYDALEQNKPLGGGFRILLVLFGIFGLFVYLLKRRGAKRGLLASAIAILLFIGTLLTSALSAGVFSAITGYE